MAIKQKMEDERAQADEERPQPDLCDREWTVGKSGPILGWILFVSDRMRCLALPMGEVRLIFSGNVDIRGGSGWLLIIAGESSDSKE